MNEAEAYESVAEDCSCPLPQSITTAHPALGKLVRINLCCLAQAIQALNPAKTIVVEANYDPVWAWNCTESWVEEKVNPDRTVTRVRHRRGCPPEYLWRRFKAKGVTVMHGTVPHSDTTTRLSGA